MINLLPPEEKQKLILRKKEKLATIWSIIVLVSLICFTLILLSIKFYLLSETDYQRNILQQARKEYQTPELMNFGNIIQKYNVILSQLDSFYKKEIYFSQALKTITGVSSPDGLRLTNFSLSRDKNGVIQASVSGTSDTRDNLLIFKKNIEQSLQIKNPYFSPESWIKQKNANFSLTFTINGQ